ncbi:MAG: FG-GAP-like repeat-containing protein [Thermoanaerobaculia bacterium]
MRTSSRATVVCLVLSVMSFAAAAVPAPPSLRDAQARLQSGDPAGAATLLDSITAREPENARAWRMLGVARQQMKSYDAAIAAYATAFRLEPGNPVAIYNLGTAYALKKDPDRAFEWLGKAAALHVLDMTQIEQDTDLESLRTDPRFKALLPKPEDFAQPFVEPVQILREWDGESGGDQFGWIARNIGDVDGDGVADIVTAAPTRGAGGASAGRVYVFSTRSGKLLWTADGSPGDQLGTGVEGAGDTDHDGVPDVVAGAPGGGYARVYSGRDGRELLTLRPTNGALESFGQHVKGVGDLDGDGSADLLIGAPGKPQAKDDTGWAYVYSGKSGKLLLRLAGDRAGDQFGATVGGVSQGKSMFLIVGAPGAGESKHGRTYVYDALGTKPKFVIEADETGNALGGMFVSVPGDMDGDGVADIYASDWSNTAKGPSTGRIYVHSGRDGHRLLTLTGETAGEGFGTSPANAGDVDGDGRADLIVGAWNYSVAAAAGGRAYLYSGKDGSLVKTFTGRIPGEAFGFDAVTMGDTDGDGTVDFLITSAWSGIHGFHSGRIFLLSSGVKRQVPATRN